MEGVTQTLRRRRLLLPGHKDTPEKRSRLEKAPREKVRFSSRLGRIALTAGVASQAVVSYSQPSEFGDSLHGTLSAHSSWTA
jgi:hypothetical protein